MNTTPGCGPRSSALDKVLAGPRRPRLIQHLATLDICGLGKVEAVGTEGVWVCVCADVATMGGS